MKLKSWMGWFVAVGTLALPSALSDDYDRLDGRGKSKTRVDVIEWQKNLEVHVYPKGRTLSLAMKLDKRDKNKPVMVIGYRFKTQPEKQLVRRAILGIKIVKGFKVFKDPSTKEYDKFIISNKPQGGKLVAFKLEPGPNQLYPDGHPALKKKEAPRNTASTPGPGTTAAPTPTPARTQQNAAPKAKSVDDSGAIQFKW